MKLLKANIEIIGRNDLTFELLYQYVPVEVALASYLAPSVNTLI